jgi:hypothetical protein
MWDKGKLGNITHSCRKFLMLKRHPLNVVSHSVAVYKNVSSTLNGDLLHDEGNLSLCGQAVKKIYFTVTKHNFLIETFAVLLNIFLTETVCNAFRIS